MYDLKCYRCGRARNQVPQLPVLERGEQVELEKACRCGSTLFIRADKVHRIGATPAHWADQCTGGDGRLLKD